MTHKHELYNPQLWVVEYWLSEKQTCAARMESECSWMLKGVFLFFGQINLIIFAR